MRTVLRVLLGALVGSAACVSTAAAQAGVVSLPDLLSGIGFTAGAGALIAWGTQKEKVTSHGRRLDVVEQDRVTREEFATMGATIRNIEHDIRQVREMLERRYRPRDE